MSYCKNKKKYIIILLLITVFLCQDAGLGLVAASNLCVLAKESVFQKEDSQVTGDSQAMGKQAEQYDVVNRGDKLFAKARDRQTKEHLGEMELDLIAVVTPEMALPLKVLVHDEEGGYIIERIISLFSRYRELQRLRIYAYDNLFSDLFGFSYPQGQLIGRHRSLTRNIIAVFHELLHFLFARGFFYLQKEGQILQITFGREGTVTLDVSRALTGLADDEEEWVYWPDWRMNLWDNQHYLFRLLQRQIFAENDRKLTTKMQAIQRIRDSLVARIAEQGGKIPFIDYMQEVLYSENGYYSAGAVEISGSGDFSTYSEEKEFGYCLAKQLQEMWDKMGRPEKFSVVEMGAGNGSLARNIISFMRLNAPSLYEALDYVIIEISSELVDKKQKPRLAEYREKVRWVKGNALEMSQLEEIEGVFLSNELVDEFPVHRVKKVNGEFKEIYVTYRGGRFQDTLGELSSWELRRYVEGLAVELPEGAEIPVNLNINRWQQEIASRLKRGFVVTIDYGGKLEEIIIGTKHAVWNRQYSEMEKLYIMLLCDLTASVNFLDIVRSGQRQGLALQGFVLQRDFLWSLGIVEMDISEELEQEVATQMGYRVLVQRKDMPAETWFRSLRKNKHYRFPYKADVRLVLPLGTDQSEFIVFADPLTDREIDSRLFAAGEQALRNHLEGFLGHYSDSEFCGIRDAETGGFTEDGRYQVQFTREQLQSVIVRDQFGQVIFDGSKYFAANPQALKQLVLDYDKYVGHYATRLDLRREDIKPIYYKYYLTAAGKLTVTDWQDRAAGTADLPEQIAHSV